MTDFDRVRRRLIDELAKLSAQVRRIEETQGQPLDDDFEEQAIDREDDEALDAMELSALAQIAQTRQALARLDSGGYGLCTACGEPIALARLEALPAAGQCIQCASAAEFDRI